MPEAARKGVSDAFVVLNFGCLECVWERLSVRCPDAVLFIRRLKDHQGLGRHRAVGQPLAGKGATHHHPCASPPRRKSRQAFARRWLLGWRPWIRIAARPHPAAPRTSTPSAVSRENQGAPKAKTITSQSSPSGSSTNSRTISTGALIGAVTLVECQGELEADHPLRPKRFVREPAA